MYKDMYVCAFQGNVVLTDFEYTILSLLRTRTDTEDVRFVVRDKYPIHSARQREPMMNQERYSTISLAPYIIQDPPVFQYIIHKLFFALSSLVFDIGPEFINFIKQLYMKVTSLTSVHKLFCPCQ